MPDIKTLTVKHLRELARRHLGPGHSRWTRDELVAALKKVPGALKDALAQAVAKVPRRAAAKKAAPEVQEDAGRRGTMVSAAKRRAPKKAKGGGGAEKKGPAVDVVKFPKKARAKKPVVVAPVETPPRGGRPLPAITPTEPQPVGKGKKGSAPAPHLHSVEADEAGSREGGAEAAATETGKRGRGGKDSAREGSPATTKSVREGVAASSKSDRVEPARGARSEPSSASAPDAAAPQRAEPSGAPTGKRGASASSPRVERSATKSEAERAAAATSKSEREPDAAATSKSDRAAAPSSSSRRPRPRPSQHEAEPVLEGFFLARVAGSSEVRAHHLARRGGGAPAFDENLGTLPAKYPEPAAVALPRDPRTLFVYWSFPPDLLATASADLSSPRSVLRIYESAALLREVPFDLSGTSFYLGDLPPGRTLRVEAWFVGRDGRSRRIGAPSPAVTLPTEGAAPNTQVQFLRVPADTPLAALQRSLQSEGGDAVEALAHVTWERTDLPGSAEGWRGTKTVKVTGERPRGLPESKRRGDALGSSPRGPGGGSGSGPGRGD